jgi:stage II sporulation protein D (peptidoglycan lytic transglycosylase)
MWHNIISVHFLLGISLFFAAHLSADNELETQKPIYQVRVLLADLNQLSAGCEITTEKGFLLADPVHGNSTMRSSTNKLLVTLKDNFFYLNGKRLLKKTCVIKPREGALVFEGNNYHGNFIITIQGTCAYLINSLNIEDYIFSVLNSEGWPGWPHEMYKVLAITCRSYMMAMIRQAYESGRLYHVKNTNAHQTYKGTHTNHKLRKAVDDTQGLFLTYNNNPIIAMFDICCGGVIPAGIHGFDFGKAPYLARNYPCTHCKNCSSYSWQLSCDKHDIITQLQKEFPQLMAVKDVKISKKDKAGLVIEAQIKTPRTTISIPGRKLYSIIDGIRSFCFVIQRIGNAVVFKGRGFGHHLGLCQWGARAMVRDGWDHRKILSFYYPETKLMRLT